MLLRKKGFPEDGELVLCTVTKIFHHSVFVNLDEYDRSGLIHISEISPGRIRNLRDYVTEGKKIVCVVLRVNQEKGHIDLSLRRVNERQRIGKNNQIKMEQKSEKIVELIAKKSGDDPIKVYDKLFGKICNKFDNLTECFEEVVVDSLKLESLGVEKQLAAELTEMIKQRMTPPEVEIKGQIHITTYQKDGVDLIKNTLMDALKSQKDIKIKYAGSGKYNISVISDDFKDAEKKMNKAIEKITKPIEKAKGFVEFKRVDI